jgi:hypothetical protein
MRWRKLESIWKRELRESAHDISAIVRKLAAY